MWHKAQAQPSQSGAGQPHLLGQSARCQGRLVHRASNAQSQCGQETWLTGHPSWPANLTSGPLESHFQPKHRLNPAINTPVLLPAKSVKKVRFSSNNAPKFILYTVERDEVLMAGGLPGLLGVLGVARARKL
jgi:hypothetical protein